MTDDIDAVVAGLSDEEFAAFDLYEIEREYPDLLVASVFGPRDQAAAEIMRYAMIYSQDGPVAIRAALQEKG